MRKLTHTQKAIHLKRNKYFYQKPNITWMLLNLNCQATKAKTKQQRPDNKQNLKKAPTKVNRIFYHRIKTQIISNNNDLDYLTPYLSLPEFNFVSKMEEKHD